MTDYKNECTKAERELIEAAVGYFDPHSPMVGLPTVDEAMKAVLAERAPKTPEQKFEAAVREAWERYDSRVDFEAIDFISTVRQALCALNNARREAARGDRGGA